MSELKLTADSGGGSVSFKGPATTTGNAAVPFVLPVADGSTGQFLKTDGSKNLSWDTVSSTPEGTAVLSTGESGGTKYLREDGDGSCSWQTVSSDPTTTSGTNNFTVADGDLVIGTSGHGISFAADGHATNMSSELLDDYEEGDFTVTLSATGGGTLGISGNDHMKYTKIGNRVFISGSIDCNAHSSATGYLQVNGFPFTVEHDGQAASATHMGVVYFRGGDSTPGSTGNYGEFPVVFQVHANQTYIDAFAVYGGLTDSGSQTICQYIGESTFIYLNFSYVAA